MASKHERIYYLEEIIEDHLLLLLEHGARLELREKWLKNLSEKLPPNVLHMLELETLKSNYKLNLSQFAARTNQQVFHERLDEEIQE